MRLPHCGALEGIHKAAIFLGTTTGPATGAPSAIPQALDLPVGCADESSLSSARRHRQSEASSGHASRAAMVALSWFTAMLWINASRSAELSNSHQCNSVEVLVKILLMRNCLAG